MNRSTSAFSRFRYLPLVLVACVGIGLSVLSFSIVAGWEQSRTETGFARAGESRVSALRRGLDQHLLELEAIGALYGATEEVDRREFHEFVRPFLARRSGIQALEWIPRIPDAQRAAYEEAARKEGFAEFRITERVAQGKMVRAARRDEYFPVYYVEPYKGNETALGFDLASDPTRLEALGRARDTGEMVASTRITLVQERGQQFGFLAFLPVYRKDAPADSVESRRKNLEGFGLAVFRIGDAVKHALAYWETEGIDVHVFDASASAGERFLCSLSSRPTPVAPTEDEAALRVGLHYASTLPVGGREWLVICTPSSEFLESRQTWQPWIILAGGLLCTGFLTAYLWLILGSAARTRLFVAEQTKAKQELEREIVDRKRAEETLRLSEERYRTLVENLPIGLYRNTPGPRGKFLAVNFAHARMFGYESVEEFLKTPVADLYQDPAERKAFSDKLIAEGSVFRAEIRLRKKDGTPIWGAVTASAVRNEAGEIEYFDGVIEDITERKAAQRRIEAAAQLVNQISPLSDRAELLNLVIHRATDLLEADFGVIAELDPDTGAIGTVYPANFPMSRIPDGTQVKGQGILRRIVGGEVVWTPDVTTDPDYIGYPSWHPRVGPCLGMPLRLLGKVLGLMLIGREKGKPPFAEEDRNFAMALAHHAAVGIDRTRRMEMLRAMSLIDQLTGLHNRRGFLILAEQQLKLASRTQKGLLLVFADLDGLKWINDSLGHQEGDAALTALSRVLRETFRGSDIIAPGGR